jgi:hypothetical protein
MRATVAFFLLVGCNVTQPGDLGNLVFDDDESLSAPGSGAFVVGDELRLSASVSFSATVFVEEVIAQSSDESVFQFDTTPGGLSFRGTVVGEGEADLEILDSTTLQLIDQISLRSAAMSSVAVGLAAPFEGGESISESFESLQMLPRDQITLLTKPVSSTGEELKGQLLSALFVDAAVATAPIEIEIGRSFTLGAVDLGSSALTFDTNTIPIQVVSSDDVTLSLNIPEQGNLPISQGTLIVDALLSDGSNLDSERYNIEEVCVAGSANEPCLLDIEPSFSPNAVIFAARQNGRATIRVSLVDIDDEVLQSSDIVVDVIAD